LGLGRIGRAHLKRRLSKGFGQLKGGIFLGPIGLGRLKRVFSKEGRKRAFLKEKRVLKGKGFLIYFPFG